MTHEPQADGAQRHLTPMSTSAISRVGAVGFPLTDAQTEALVRSALDEDAAFHDVSTLSTVVSDRHVRATLVARQTGVIAGVPLACEAFRLLDKGVSARVEQIDGSMVEAGAVILRLNGHARALLSAERVALNFMQRLSGIASLTARFVAAVQGTQARILDTRKTTPGWRRLEKYAVLTGGGENHRFDLRSGVLIKDNHLAAIGGDIALAVQRARGIAATGTVIQIECDNLAQVQAAIDADADSVLLDNMSLNDLRHAVAMCGGRVVTEASGGVTLATVRNIAECGVDRISIGALTHSAPALDLALDFDGL
jgi:nicotinate-nucleotide pyrophosphorylase (carboxylating)